jgi:hypothetical protein
MPAHQIQPGLVLHSYLAHVHADANAKRLQVGMRLVKGRGLLLYPQRPVHRRGWLGKHRHHRVSDVLHHQAGPALFDRANHNFIVMPKQLDGMSISSAFGDFRESLDVGEEDYQHRSLPLHAVLLDARKVQIRQVQRSTIRHGL